jgi:apolipoprotein N-acyltransferase
MDGDPVESAASTATVADVPPATATTPLAETGSTVHWGYGLLALLLVGIGAAALLIRLIRRRRNA